MALKLFVNTNSKSDCIPWIMVQQLNIDSRNPWQQKKKKNENRKKYKADRQTEFS